MAMQRKIIGKLPVYRREYDSATVYGKYNIVTYLGSSFISVKDNNTSVPCVVSNGEFVLSDGWDFFSDNSSAYFLDERFDAMVDVTVTTDDEGDVNLVESDLVNEAIRKTPQTLSNAEKKQARTNIGSASLEENAAFVEEVEKSVSEIDSKVVELASKVSEFQDNVIGYVIKGVGKEAFSYVVLSKIIPAGSVVLNLGNSTEYVYLMNYSSKERIPLYGKREVTLEFDVDVLQMPNVVSLAYELKVKGVLDDKQNLLIFDKEPEKDSNNVVTSGVVYNIVENFESSINGKECSERIDVEYGKNLKFTFNIVIKKGQKFKISLGNTSSILNGRRLSLFINGNTSYTFGYVPVGSSSEFVASEDIAKIMLYLESRYIDEDGSVDLFVNIHGLSSEIEAIKDDESIMNLQNKFVVRETRQEVVMNGEQVVRINHYIGEDVVRTDEITYGDSIIQELRTLNNGKSLTTIFDINTFETTLKYN